MLNLFILAFMITTVVSKEIVGIEYTFGDDFYWSFDYKTCRNATRWNLLRFTNTEIVSYKTENSYAIKSLSNSCVSSFLIVFLPDSVLEINVYLQLRTLHSGLVISVIDEFNIPVLNFSFYKTSVNYTPGWNKILIPITKHFTGYVRFQGRNEIEEIVLIDSFTYIIYETKDKKYKDNDNSNETLKENDNSQWMIAKNIHRSLEIVDLGNDDANFVEGSGDDINTTPSENTTELPPTAPSSSFWNIWTVLLVSITSLSLIGVITISAYHCGKKRGREEHDGMLENQELPRTLRLPRVNNMYTGSFSDRFSRYR